MLKLIRYDPPCDLSCPPLLLCYRLQFLDLSLRPLRYLWTTPWPKKKKVPIPNLFLRKKNLTFSVHSLWSGQMTFLSSNQSYKSNFVSKHWFQINSYCIIWGISNYQNGSNKWKEIKVLSYCTKKFFTALDLKQNVKIKKFIFLLIGKVTRLCDIFNDKPSKNIITLDAV